MRLGRPFFKKAGKVRGVVLLPASLANMCKNRRTFFYIN